ncbi:MAG: InlB B-repeat-containing protein, partial [Candidatus Riflebacteria bacterium]
MRQRTFVVSLFVLLAVIFLQLPGCRLIDGYSDDTAASAPVIPMFNLVGTIILPATTEDAASLRINGSEGLRPGVTVSGDLLLSGVEVWIDELPNFPHQFTNDEGRYSFQGIPFGSYHVVAAYTTTSSKTMKVRSTQVEVGAASATEVLVPEMTLKEANKVVTGVLRDDSGNYMPEGTVLVLWGEKFTVGTSGTFTSPPLPDDVTAAPLIVLNTPLTSAPAVLQPVVDLPQVQIQFVSSEVPTTVDLQVVEDTTRPLPVGAVVDVSKNGQPLNGAKIAVNRNDSLFLQVNLVNVDLSFPGLTYEWDAGRGSFAHDTVNQASATWVVPEDAGPATISITVTTPDRGFIKLFIPLTVELPVLNPVFLVSFDARGGSAVTPASVAKGDKVAEPASPVRSGFTFGGWYKEATCITPWNFASETVSDNLKLYARWITVAIQTVQVLFDSAGGSPVAIRNVIPGEKIAEPATPIRDGYIFGGWFKDAELSKPWNFAGENVLAGMTLFARWQRITHEVIFNTAGASEIPAKTVNHGEKIAEPARPTYDGFNFSGWFKDAEGTAPWDFANDAVVGDTTLYARWAPVAQKTIEVIFDSLGGSTVSNQVLMPGEKILEPAKPVREGFLFADWFKDAACTQPWMFAVETVSVNLTLYARWFPVTAKTAEVNFESNGGSAVPAKTVVPGEKITEPAQPQRAGFDFTGWYKETTLTNKWNFSTDIVNSTMTLYAGWAVKSLIVTFDSAGGNAVTSQNVNFGEKASEPAAPTRVNYVFSGWYKESACLNTWNFSIETVLNNITLYAKWVPKTAEVRFDSAGGSTVTALNVVLGSKIMEPAPPVKDGYNFGGWYKEPDLINLWNFAGDLVAGNLKLYARWIAKTAQTVEVRFDSTGGSNLTAKTVVPGEKISEPTPPTREGYSFGGWYKEAALTNSWNFTTDTVTANSTLYARWTQLTFSFQFDAAGGSAVTSQTIAYGGKAAEPNAPTREGYSFGGWYKEAALTNQWNFTTDTVTTNTTLYARWTQLTFSFQFDAAGGSAVTSQTIAYGGKATEPTAPTREGYSFGGWYKEAALTNSWNFTTDTVTTNTTLYARWT